jgi:hypothetical protein
LEGAIERLDQWLRLAFPSIKQDACNEAIGDEEIDEALCVNQTIVSAGAGCFRPETSTRGFRETGKTLFKTINCVVEPGGIEPPTSSMPLKRSPN